MTLLPDVLRSAAARLADAGVPSPRHDAEALAGHVLGVARGEVTCLRELTADQAVAFWRLVDRRANREPLQHLTGQAGFRHLCLAVGPGVFIPRPETEIMVDWCLAQLRPGATVVDLCAGSGAIGLSLATERPGTAVYAVDSDPAAYAWLQRNAAAQAASGLQTVLADVADLATAAPQLLGSVDVVVSNPPYIPLGCSPLEPEVARYDPAVALWGGRDGLDMMHAVERIARRLLVPGGRIALEHADTQRSAVLGLLAGAGGWTNVLDHPDLAGRDRFATATWLG